MTVIGTDASSRAGGPQPIGIEEGQASAAVAVPREQLGLVSDSLLNVVITTKEDQRTGHFKSDASHPALAHLQMRLDAIPLPMHAEEAERSQYAALVGLLPRGMRRRLGVPLGEMDSADAALANVVRFAARLMAHVDEGGGEGISAEKLALYRLLPHVALCGAIETGGEVLAAAERALAWAPGDGWREALTTYGEVYHFFRASSLRIAEGEMRAGDAERCGALVERMRGAKGAKLLVAQAEVFGALIGAFGTRGGASAALLLGVSLASLGCGSGGVSDPCGAQMRALFSLLGFSGGLASAFAAELLMGAALGAKAVLGGGLGPTPAQGEEEREWARRLELALLLEVVIRGEVPEALFGGVAEAVGVAERERVSLQRQLFSLTLLWIGAVAGSGEISEQAALLSGAALQPLSEFFAAAAAAESDRAAAGGSREVAALAAHLERSRVAAESGDLEGCLEALWSALPLCGSSRGAFFGGVAAAGSRAEASLIALSDSRREDGGQATEVALPI